MRMTEKPQVNLEPVKNKTSTCSEKRILLVLILMVIVVLVVVGFGYLISKSIEDDSEIKSIKNEQNEIRHRFKDTDNSMRRYIDKRMVDFRNQIQPKKASNSSSINTELRKSVEGMKDHLNAVISTTGNLSEVLARMNTSSESKMSRLRSNLKNARNDLIRLQNELTQLNYTLHKNMGHLGDSIFSAVKDLREELHKLKNSTTTKANELWKHWNKTDEEIEDVIKLITQQNETLHFKIAYHSDILYSKVKDLQKQQNYTSRSLAKQSGDLNHTRENLQHDISRVNKSLHIELENFVASLDSSLANVNVKVDKMKKQLEGKIDSILDKQKEFQTMKNDYSESKASFQEQDRKHGTDISSQGSKIKRMEEKMKNLERELDSKKNLEKKVEDLMRRMEKIENEASDMPNTNVKLIFVTAVLSYCTCNYIF